MRIRSNTHSHGSLIAMFAALGLALPMTASALLADCPDPIMGAEQASAVLSETTNNGGGSFGYLFRVCNISDREIGDLIRDWELPFFDDAGIGDFVLPVTGGEWAVAIEDKDAANPDTGWDGITEWDDPMNPFHDPRYDAAEFVLHFYTGFCEGEFCGSDFITPGDYRIFGFTADYGPTSAPYQASWTQLPPRTGDPDFPLVAGVPNSPSLRTIPEPGSLALAALGLGLLARRRS